VIDGVAIKDLVTHGDARGFFREVIRVTDPFFEEGFGQFSHSLVQAGVVKAWHGHRVQTQWTYLASGRIRVAIYDARPGSPTFGRIDELVLGDDHSPRVYRLPVGVLHGYRCLVGPAHVCYLTSGTYDLADEVRVPHDDAGIGYDWGAGVVV